MDAPTNLFKLGGVVAGNMSGKAYGKFDTKIQVQLKNVDSSFASKVRSQVATELKKVNLEGVQVRQISGGFSVLYDSSINQKVVDALGFKLIGHVSKIEHMHIAEKHLEALDSEFGNVLRNDLWYKKYRYRAELTMENTWQTLDVKKALQYLSDTMSGNTEFIEVARKAYSAKTLGNESYKPTDSHYLTTNKVAGGGFMSWRSSYEKMCFYSEEPSDLTVMSLCVPNGMKLKMEKAVLFSEC